MSAAREHSPQRLRVLLGGFFFVYFGCLGLFMPYWPMYLQTLGLGASAIGSMMAANSLMRIAGPLAWGWYMDRRRRRTGPIAMAMLAGLAPLAAIPFLGALPALLLAQSLYALFWAAGNPAFDVVALAHAPAVRRHYSQIRLWGSVGFIVTVLGGGALIDRAGLVVVPVSMLLGMLLLAWIARHTPDAESSLPDARQGESFARGLRRGSFLALLLIAVLSQASFAPYYTFFSIYLERLGYSATETGGLWALGVLAEIVLFVYAGSLIERFGVRRMLLWAMATTTLRWLLTAGLAAHPLALAASQLLHMTSFGLFYAATVHYVQTRFERAAQGRAQALVTSAGFGLGGALGALTSGAVWQLHPGAPIFVAAALVAALGYGVTAFGFERRPPSDRRG